MERIPVSERCPVSSAHPENLSHSRTLRQTGEYSNDCSTFSLGVDEVASILCGTVVCNVMFLQFFF